MLIFFILLCAVLLLVYLATVLNDNEKIIHVEHSNFRDILVCESRLERYMRFSRKGSSKQTRMLLSATGLLIVNYNKMMLGALYLNPRPSKILMIGLGGGTLATAVSSIFPEIDIDIVEIDPAVINVATKYFNFKQNSRIHIYEKDGRAFVRNARACDAAYDMIMLDAYDDQYIPGHMMTMEFLLELKRILTPDGVLSANTWKSSPLYDSESVTYEAVFGTFFNLLKTNRVILAKNNGLPDFETILNNAELVEPKLATVGTGVSFLLPLFSVRQNWNLNAEVLTDQTSALISY